MKKNIPSNKHGAVLVVVMAVVVAVTLIVAALLHLSALNERETIKQMRTTQARWLAEAGLESELSRIAASRDYRLSLPSFEPVDPAPIPLGAGQYRVKAWGNASLITILATGNTTIGDISGSSEIEMDLFYYEGIPGGITGLNSPGFTYLNKDTLVVNGDVYRNGTMVIDGVVADPHSVYATDASVTGSGIFTENPMPPPDIPLIDPTGEFANLLSFAATQTNTTFDGTLSGTNYVNGNLVLDNGISGSGTLVVTGDLTFNGSQKTISDDVDLLVEGNIIIDNHTTFGDQIEVFSQNGDITINHHIDGGAVAIIAKNGSIENSTSGHDIGPLNAMFYAGTDLILRHKLDIIGTLIAQRNIEIGHSSKPGSAKITYDPEIFGNDWHIDWGNNIVIVDYHWDEIQN